ncbi:hypothetical protein LIPSTDRAFT_227047 [Lipomyces starkeyi NRRL Y-11557]|uniref:Uncharacterized protein n=1 Tax=Lipomyces starkeyi NRRL Y-11557 TaxID=675824 RepID=A0A1E3QAL2_LIPST|nr:hypothetical protein LIPSTDRAFT_227047 [Lipomyces starkeyi NRRL Y-11557]
MSWQNILCIGLVFESDSRAVVNAHAINNNFAIKNGVVKHKDQTLLIVCKCSRRPLNTGNLAMEVGTNGDNGLPPSYVARSAPESSFQKTTRRFVDPCRAC